MELSGSIGLCASCRWCRRVPNRRGSVFFACRRAELDPAYPRYPRLPLRRCAGYEPASAGADDRARLARRPAERGETKMPSYLVVTVIGEDAPGLVEALARRVAEHDGNWLESRMSHLAGKFAGILRVSVPEEKAEALAAGLGSLPGLRVVAERSDAPDAGSRPARLELTGADHPGIVRDITRVLVGRGVNVEELETRCEAAPMSGQMLFKASVRLHLPEGLTLDDLRRALEDVAQDLMVDVKVAEGVKS